MKTLYTFTLLLFLSGLVYAQNTSQRVYNIFQTNCATAGCHNTATKAANLDLEGSGANLQAKMQDVYNNYLYQITPTNTHAANQGYARIYPGDPYRSFLFRKINNGLAPEVALHANEGNNMPIGAPSLSDNDKELIRQWIIYGAKPNGDDVDVNLINDFYDNGGIETVPNIPAPPAASDGFQIHFGPFFVEPGGEVEFFSKYELNNPDSVEVTSIQTEMGTFSHHFIIYQFVNQNGMPSNPTNLDYGLRDDGFGLNSTVITEQYSNTLNLPNKTAFRWLPQTVFDLNSHYINYDSTRVLKCDVFVNVRTQPKNTAAQIMHSNMAFNLNIPIPNNNQVTTHQLPLTFNFLKQLNPFIENNQLYMWSIVGHTHKYGTDFNVSIENNQIYDAGCANGIPGCGIEAFDYAHQPFRFFDNYLPFSSGEVINAEAKWVNNGPTDVDWGLTSDDEMLLYTFYFVNDTAGLNLGPTSINQPNQQAININVSPNPVSKQSYVNITGYKGLVSFKLYSLTGQLIQNTPLSPASNKILITNNNKPKGIYYFRLSDANGNLLKTGKLAVK